MSPLPLLGVGFLGADIVAGVRQSDIIGLACIAVTGLFSVVSWAVVAYKWLHIRRVEHQTDSFVAECLESGGSIEEAYQASAAYPDCPLAEILRETVVEMEVEGWYKEGHDLSLEDRLALAQTSLTRVVDRTIAAETRDLESHLIFLATTASVCPLIGLFGTVWGILGAFQVIATASTGAITALAPGISTALVTTVAGLVAAIPAQLFYNWFVNRVDAITHRMDAFALELANIVQRRIARGG